MAKRVFVLLVAGILATEWCSGQPIPVKGKAIERSTTYPALAKELAAFQIFEIESNWLLDQVHPAAAASLIHLELGDFFEENIELIPEDIRAKHYQVVVQEPKGQQHLPGRDVLTFKGLLGEEKGACRLTLAKDFLYALFERQGETWYLEPLRGFDPAAPANWFVFYENKAVFPDVLGRCAAALLEHPTALLQAEVAEKSAQQCYALEIAIAADYLMLQLFDGDIERLENYMLAVLNNVQHSYDDEFVQEIRFQVVKLYFSNCEACDPWTTSTNSDVLLRSFRDWGNTGGFSAGYSVASLWSGRIFDDNRGGLAWIGGVCKDLRYNVLRRYSNNASIMRALQAHELGHNLFAKHDTVDAPFIMAPVIRDHANWSNESTATINTFITSSISQGNCLSGCAQGSAPLARFEASQITGCAPLTVRFENQTTPDFATWEWSVQGATNGIYYDKNPTILFENPGFYTVMLRVENTFGKDSTTMLIKVLSQPQAAFSADIVLGQTSVAFQNQSANMERSLWNFGNGQTSSEINPVHDFLADGIYHTTLIASNTCGADTITQTIKIVTPPKAAFIAIDTIGCAPLTVQYSNQSSANAESWIWAFEGGTPAASIEQHPIVVYQQPGSFDAGLRVSNAAGNQQLIKKDLITVKAKPQAAFESSYQIGEKTAIFTNQSSSFQTLQWNFGDGSTSIENNPLHAFESDGTYPIQLSVHNECGADTFLQYLTIITPPEAHFTVLDSAGCAPFQVQYHNQSSTNATQFQWQFPGGTPAQSTEENPVVMYQEAGIFGASLSAENAWGIKTFAKNELIAVQSAPIADFTFSIAEDTIRFSNLSTHVADFLWHFGDGESSTAVHPVHVYKESGFYEVALFAMNECGTSQQRATAPVLLTKTSQPHWIEEFLLFPNPNNGIFAVSLQGKPQAQLLLRLVNSLGQEVHRVRLPFWAGSLSQSLQTQHLTPGIYLLLIQSEQGVWTHPVVIQQ